MDVTVFSPVEPCMKCSVTKRRLSKNDVPFSDVVADDAMVERFKAEGHSSFPVVVVDLGDGATWTWSDCRPDHISRLVDLRKLESLEAA